MKKKFTYITIAVAAVLILTIVLLVVNYTANNYVAKVGGEKLTKAEYKYFLYNLKNQMEQTGNVQKGDKKAEKEFWLNKIGTEKAEDVLKSRTLDNAWEFKIQYIKAKQAGTSVDKSRLTEVYKNIDDYVATLGAGMVGKQKFKEENGLSVGEMKDVVKEQLMVMTFADNTQKAVKPTDAQLKEYYDKNSSVKEMVNTATVRHVLILTKKDDKDMTAEEKKAAKKKAEEILAKAKAGQKMEDLVKQYSEDPGAKENAGIYEFNKSGLLKNSQQGESVVSQFPDWAFKAKVNDISLVETEYGYHIVKLEKLSTFEDAKEDVRTQYRETEYKKSVDSWKKDKQYTIAKNTNAYNSITVVSE